MDEKYADILSDIDNEIITDSDSDESINGSDIILKRLNNQ